MLTAIEFYRAVPLNMPKIVREMQEWLKKLPDREIAEDGTGLWSCHALTRAAKLKWQLDRWEVADGFYNVSFQHSWLMRNGDHKYPKLILDVYPIASLGGPIILEALPSIDALYKENDAAYGINHRAQWRRETDMILVASHCIS